MFRLTDFTLLTEEQQKELVLEDYGPRADYPDHRTVVELFEEQAARTPQHKALVCGTRSLTYAELNQQANRVAHCLGQAYGVGPGHVVGLLMDRTEPLVVALLGILKAGAAYLPIDPDNPADRVGYVLENAAARLCLVNGDATAQLAYQQGDVPRVLFATLEGESAGLPAENPPPAARPGDLAYVIYTSGSTGLPKGVAVTHANLVNYTCWANEYYFGNRPGYPFPLFTSIAFDLTVTSLFTTLLRGDQVILHPEKDLYEVLERIFGMHSEAKVVKLTPSHVSILSYLPLTHTRVTCAIVGGEALTPGQVKTLKRLNPDMRVFNEYGPTEATVGCTIKEVGAHDQTVTIGRPIANTGICLLDESLNVLPRGAVGEICVAGKGVAAGYLNNDPLTGQKFITHPAVAGRRLYRTGDLGRWRPDGDLELLGRKDMQVKLNGYRVELEEVESVLGTHPDVVACVADLKAVGPPGPAPGHDAACTRCGIAANYPGIRFDEQGVCNMCRSYEAYKDKAQAYFKETDELRGLLAEVKANSRGPYDCLMLYSGGKDSTYVLCQLVKEFGLRVLAFSFDNGYISQQAKDNIRRVTDALGVDLVFGTTPHMNEIFVDSLQRHSNVCNGCFKTIYTLGLQMAREQNIRCVVTGLSRGQLYETRLYQLFGSAVFDPGQVDRNILDARKTYHRLDDAVSRCLNVEMFRDGRIFEEIRIVDFFRYTSVELKDMYSYLDQHVPWVRPSDTGRSTNCRINDLGIYVHKQERGYHNYALPYSWDVRMGHKTRAEAVDELNDRIDVQAVQQMMAEIGYRPAPKPEAGKQLVAYYVSPQPLDHAALKHFLARKLPHYMLPTAFVRLDALPLTLNGKVNRQLLPALTEEQLLAEEVYEAPRNEIEEKLAASWREVLQIGKAGIHHNFFTLGGSSLKIVMLHERLEALFPGALRVGNLFDNPTIAAQARLIESKRTGGSPVPGPVYDVVEL